MKAQRSQAIFTGTQSQEVAELCSTDSLCHSPSSSIIPLLLYEALNKHPSLSVTQFPHLYSERIGLLISKSLPVEHAVFTFLGDPFAGDKTWGESSGDNSLSEGRVLMVGLGCAVLCAGPLGGSGGSGGTTPGIQLAWGGLGASRQGKGAVLFLAGPRATREHQDPHTSGRER